MQIRRPPRRASSNDLEPLKAAHRRNSLDNLRQAKSFRTTRFKSVTKVSKSWDKLKAIPDYQLETAKVLFKKLFELSPDSQWSMFPFADEYKSTGDECFSSPLFIDHASKFIRMLDLAVHMLGPETELIENVIRDAGARHAKLGVLPEHYPIMGEALMYTLEQLLGASFNDKYRRAWDEIYTFLTSTMVLGAVGPDET